jgi:hypothetical protein
MRIHRTFLTITIKKCRIHRTFSHSGGVYFRKNAEKIAIMD